MDYLITSGDIINIVSDITAGVFLTVLVISTITHQIARHPGFTHLFAATMLILAGIFVRFFAIMLGMLPDGTEWKLVTGIPVTGSADVIWIMAFILISVGICESVVHVIYVNEGESRAVYRPILIMSGMISAFGILFFVFSHSINAFTLAILIQLLCLNIFLYRSRFERAGLQFRRASMIAIVTFVIPLFFGSVRLTGLGLSLMLIILNEQYHERIGQELAENEAALARSRLQLLTEQISPHYIYNSLQSIRDLCGNDPEKARDAVDAFSEYLRGNLESLTKEELIPFSRELEHTRAYLELEKIAGRRRFDVEYYLDTEDFMLPPLVLQPIVENAVKHGAGGSPEEMIITIAAHETEEAVCIEVTDRSASGAASDAGKDPAQKTAGNSNKKQTVGLGNVQTRLAIQCGGSLDISSSGDGTKVTIILPEAQKYAKLRKP